MLSNIHSWNRYRDELEDTLCVAAVPCGAEIKMRRTRFLITKACPQPLPGLDSVWSYNY